VEKTFAEPQTLGQFREKLLAVASAFLVLQNVSADEPAGFPIAANFDCFDLLLACQKDLPKSGEQRSEVRRRLHIRWNEVAVNDRIIAPGTGAGNVRRKRVLVLIALKNRNGSKILI